MLVTDNYYTNHNTHLCGRIKTSRCNYSKDIIKKVLEKGQAVFYVNIDDPMIACKHWSATDKASG